MDHLFEGSAAWPVHECDSPPGKAPEASRKDLWTQCHIVCCETSPYAHNALFCCHWNVLAVGIAQGKSHAGAILTQARHLTPYLLLPQLSPQSLKGTHKWGGKFLEKQFGTQMLSHFILMKLYYLRRAEGKTSDYVEGTNATGQGLACRGTVLERAETSSMAVFMQGPLCIELGIKIFMLFVIKGKKDSLTSVLVDNCTDSYCQRPTYDFLLFPFYHVILFFNTGSST